MSVDAAAQLLPLPYEAWEPTKTTLHLWAQIVGKIRLKSTPHRNQWWNVTLALTPRGIAARDMIAQGVDFELEFDLIDHRLVGRAHTGKCSFFELKNGLSVAAFYNQTLQLLEELGVHVSILAKPYGVAITTPFANDEQHRTYDKELVQRWWQIGGWTVDTFNRFAAEFAGKQSPAHLFWHSFDIAMARFSGKRAPVKTGANGVEREAYAFEVISVGFWSGDQNIPAPTYYTYTAPEPPALTQQALRPADARWVPSGSGHLGVLAYDAVRQSDDPRAMLMDFLRSGYQAGTTAAGWDVDALKTSFQ